MTIRRSIVLAAVVPALLTAASPAPAATPKAKPSCAAKKSVTLKSTRSVRVYRQGRDLIGCRRATGRDTALYRHSELRGSGTDAGWSDVKVRGTVVAWHTFYVESKSCTNPSICVRGGREDTIESTDLGTRRDVSRALLFNAEPTAYAVTTTGKLVALAGTTLLGSDGPGRAQRVLDTGVIDGRSVRAEISVVSWVRGGVERFARVR